MSGDMSSATGVCFSFLQRVMFILKGKQLILSEAKSIVRSLEFTVGIKEPLAEFAVLGSKSIKFLLELIHGDEM